MGVSDQRHVPAALPPGKRAETHSTRDRVGPWADKDGCRKSRHHRDSIPGPSSLQRIDMLSSYILNHQICSKLPNVFENLYAVVFYDIPQLLVQALLKISCNEVINVYCFNTAALKSLAIRCFNMLL